jgi:hypothetical protein
MLSVECKYKIVKSANSLQKNGLIYKNVKMLKILMVVWAVLQFCGLLVHQRRGDRAVGSGGFLSYACYCFSLLRG